MKSSSKTTAQLIAELNRDLTLDDTKIIWAGAAVLLHSADLSKLLASFTANTMTMDKIVAWLHKNSYRCSQIQDGRIWL